jgi:membrane-associated phospholipid phosphatase
MRNKEIPTSAWFIPVIPIALATAIYFGEVQSSSFLFINRFTQLLPDTVWAWLTFFGNGWGVFAMAFPLLLLAPRLLTAGIFAGGFAAIASFSLKTLFDLPRPAGILLDGSFYRIGEPLLNRALPSGHTLTAFAIASALYFSVDQSKRRPMLLIFVFASLIGLSRNAVGAHWLTDVLAGAGVGMWCGLLGAMLAQHISDSRLSPTSLWPRVIAIAGALSIYVHLTQIMDLELNLPLQYASIAIITLTLILFIKAQFIKTK